MLFPRCLSVVVAFVLWVAQGRVCAQDIRISEFLVTNTTGITASDGVRYGWVEIWNPSRTIRHNLFGFQLTDGTNTWVFPSVDLLPDDRLLVWASGLNRAVPMGPLHTNFTLNPAGGTLRLLRPNATSVASEYVDYPAQQANVSYGQDAADVAKVGFYAIPTPGAPNNYSGFGVAGKVVFSVDSCAFTSTFQLTLSQASPQAGAEIRYTLDGTVPRGTSPLYTLPIPITSTRQVRARVFAPGLLPGETEGEAYLRLGTGMNTFSSAMPVVVMTTFGVNPITDGNSSTPDNPGYMWVWEPGADGRARLTNPPTLHTRVALDRRGSSTLNNPKFNLNVEARRDRWDEEKDVTLLGMPAHSDWVFSAPYEYDRSLLHNPFMYALSNTIGRYAVRTRNAEVFVDVTGGDVTYIPGSTTGDYFGVYNIMEKIRRGGDRVDIAKLDPYVNDPVGRTGGYIFKVDRRDTGDSGFSTPRQNSFAYYYPKEADLTTIQRSGQAQYLRSYVTSLDNAIYSANWKSPTSGYVAYMDVGAAIDHHLMNVWSFNVDALRLSGYLHKDRGGKIIYGPLWDFDRALASTDGRDENPEIWRSQSGDRGTDFFNYSWWNQLFKDIDFYQAYIDRWVALRKEAFSPVAVNALLDQLNESISAEAISRDLSRWNKAKRPWTSPFTGQNYSGQAAEVQRIKDWLQQRANFMDSQWVAPVTFSATSGRVTPGTQITLSGPAGATIYYTLDGSDPRPPGGAAPAAGNVFTYTGTPITIHATTCVRARAHNPNWTALTGVDNPPLVSTWSGRTEARFSIDPPAAAGNLVVTEINYHPTDPTTSELVVNPQLTDAAFEFIEIKNIGTTPVDLAGARLTTGVTFSLTGESAISLAPGECAIIAGNPEAFALRYGHRQNVLGPFQGDLSNGGERLVLLGESGQTIFDFTYDDAWHPLSDGGGHSLVVVDPAASPAAFSTRQNWRASVTVGGTPGVEEIAYVTTLPASAITATSAQMNASVIPDDTDSSVVFIVSGVRHEPIHVSSSGGTGSVEKVLTGLSPHTLYSYRAEVTNGAGIHLGEEVSFTTLNRSPVAQDKTLRPHAGEAFTIEVLDSASDPDGDTLAISDVTQGTHGVVSTDGTVITYTPGEGFSGSDVFTYTIADGFGGTATATVTLANTAPVAVADVVSTGGTAVTFDPRLNDSDADDDPLSVVSVTSGAFGTVSHDGAGAITYTPGSNFFGRDTFSYTITDGIAFGTAEVTVRGSQTIVLPGAVKGAQVPGQPDGTVYSKLGLPAGGLFSGEIRNGKSPRQRAIFAPDGSVRLKVGDAAPGISGGKIKGLGVPSGQAVVATIKGAGVKRSNDTVLYIDLIDGAVQAAAREGDEVEPGVRLGKFLSVDGNGETVFFLTKLAGPGVKSLNNLALCAVFPGSGLRLLLRKGDLVNGEAVVGLATLVSAPGTAAAGRWRVDSNSIGVRLTFPGKVQAIYTVPAAANSPEEWTLWMETGQAYEGLGMPRSFGLPGFGADGVAYTAQLVPGVPETVSAANDLVLLRSTPDGPALLAQEGDAAPGSDDTLLPESRFQKFADPIAGSDGRTAFMATLAGKGLNKGNKTGLWLANGDNQLRLIARTGEPAPGGGKWAVFESVVLPEGPESTLLFTAKLAIKAADGVTAKNNRGLWVLDSSGVLQLLLRTGQPLPGGTSAVKKFVALAPSAGSLGAASGLDHDQQVNALVSFADGTQSIVRIWIP